MGQGFVNGGDWSNLSKDLWAQAFWEIMVGIDERYNLMVDHWNSNGISAIPKGTRWRGPGGITVIQDAAAVASNVMFDGTEYLAKRSKGGSSDGWEYNLAGVGTQSSIESKIWLWLLRGFGFGAGSGTGIPFTRPCSHEWLDAGNFWVPNRTTGDRYLVPPLPGGTQFYASNQADFDTWVAANTTHGGPFPGNSIPVDNTYTQDVTQLETLILAKECLEAMTVFAWSVMIKGVSGNLEGRDLSTNSFSWRNLDIDDNATLRESLYDTARGAQPAQLNEVDDGPFLGFQQTAYSVHCAFYSNTAAFNPINGRTTCIVDLLRPDIKSPAKYKLATSVVPGTPLGGSVALGGYHSVSGAGVSQSVDLVMNMDWGSGSIELIIPTGTNSDGIIEQQIDPAGWPPIETGISDVEMEITVTEPTNVPFAHGTPGVQLESGVANLWALGSQFIVITDISDELTYG